MTTSAPIFYSSNPAILQSNIQNALNNIPAISTTGTSPNALVNVPSPAGGTITFQNGLSDTFFKAMTVGNNLGGVNPTVTVAIAITGQTNWNLSPTPNNSTGELGLSDTAANGQPQVNTVGGSLVLFVFDVKAGALADLRTFSSFHRSPLSRQPSLRAWDLAETSRCRSDRRCNPPPHLWPAWMASSPSRGHRISPSPCRRPPWQTRGSPSP